MTEYRIPEDLIVKLVKRGQKSTIGNVGSRKRVKYRSKIYQCKKCKTRFFMAAVGEMDSMYGECGSRNSRINKHVRSGFRALYTEIKAM